MSSADGFAPVPPLFEASVALRRGVVPVAPPSGSRPVQHCVVPVTAIAHNQLLPRPLQQHIPEAECIILSFLLSFLNHRRVPAPLLIVGGYVRDLLLGKTPDDLDLALCLAECAPDVNVTDLVNAMPDYAVQHPDLRVARIRVTTILSDESKAKQLDTAKCNFDVVVDVEQDQCQRIEVDIMPTIGEEIYTDDHRIPERNERGSIVEDTLRRDLTIGALLLEVQHCSNGSNGSNGTNGTNGSNGSNGSNGDSFNTFNASLRMRILDHYGGVEDLNRGMLRSPVPHLNNPHCQELEHTVLTTLDDRTLGVRLQILPPQKSTVLLA